MYLLYTSYIIDCKHGLLSEKLDYLKTLAKSKNVSEEAIWEIIIQQMQTFSQSDKVKIQIPTKVLQKSRKQISQVTELELTLEDLQNLVKKSKPRKIISRVSVTAHHMGREPRKRFRELHKTIGGILSKKKCAI